MTRNGDYLIHYGVKGMKWGVRKDSRSGNINKQQVRTTIQKATAPTIKSGKDKEKISPAEKTVRESKKIVDETSNVISRAAKNRAKKSNTNDISKMSDAELRKAISRMEMEKRYSELKTSQSTRRGQEVVENILQYTGSALAILGSALTIYSTIQKIK